ncbi:hypothetical protein [Streptomyces sp. KN37]|uniref:hypothetical protein n=1 Tax=Streptomyces sp. KN37 TaxID=3090667 RepID=UPI002A760817|nr:hypothetical protein [Streptomyces sp. KN37]WPO71819.1 hypothetical protein R9806_14880 [Streptomyces sp. KN37]
MTRTGDLLALAAAASVSTGTFWLAAAADAGQRYEAGLVLGLAAGLSVALLRRFTRLPLGRRRPYTFALPLPAPDWRAPLPDPHGDPEALRPHAEPRARLLSDASALGAALRHSCALPPGLRTELAASATTASIQASNSVLPPAGDGPLGPDPAYDAAYALGELVAAVEFSRIGLRALEALVTERPLRADPPCWFSPLHERGRTRTVIAGAAEEVTVCHGCAREPAPLLVPSAAGPVPYYESEAVDPRWRLLGYGAAVPDGATAMIAAARDGFRGDGTKPLGTKRLGTKVSW